MNFGEVLRTVNCVLFTINAVGLAMFMALYHTSMSGWGQRSRFIALLYGYVACAASTASTLHLNLHPPVTIATWMLTVFGAIGPVMLYLSFRDMSHDVGVRQGYHYEARFHWKRHRMRP